MTERLSDIDLYSLEQYEQALPLEQLARLRAEAPVFRHDDPELPEGFWALTRHADVEFVSRNADVFSSFEKSALISEFPQEQRGAQQVKDRPSFLPLGGFLMVSDALPA